MIISKKTRIKVFRISKSLSMFTSRVKIFILKKLKRSKDKDFYLY